MKKGKVLLGVVLMLVMAEVGFANVGDWNIYTGASYSNFSLEDINNMVAEEKNSGPSFFIGVNRNFSEKLALGGEIESMEVKLDNGKYEIGTTGYLVTANYEVIKNISLYSGMGMYFMEYDSDNLEIDGSDFGFKIGVNGNLDLNKNIGLRTLANYRYNNIEEEKITTDFRGFELGSSLVISF